MAVVFRANLGGTNQSGFTQNNFIKVSLSSTDFNVGSGFDTTNHRFSAPSAGYYAFSAAAGIQSMGDGSVAIIALYKNGSPFSETVFSAGTSVNGGPVISDIIQLAANDTVELYVLQNNAASQSVKGTASDTWLTGFLVANV